ncbi:hypothetical protein JVX91_24855 [Pseudomonas sp. PDNC002]|uniref:hypothetical protein n=1 Tax=Pseudomonas sp. PDNC002 TaxID=2811422 RepID=UPI001964CD91|nr:hypothetical protein [Pseudomonas sp. PDNC002]QRY78769.1 hypothetical protein JVX91_24855 [Pseudomonas sp. PDNC002]
MDNKDSGSNLSLWIPGSAVVLSLVVSALALTRPAFLEPRPLGGQFQVERPIEARLWQDPFDALERYRKKLKDLHPASASKAADDLCLADLPENASGEIPEIMVAVVEGGAYADEVELRRRIRYAVLAGFKNTHMVPADEQHVRCLSIEESVGDDHPLEIPFETLIADRLDPPRSMDQVPQLTKQTLLFWVKEEYLRPNPLEKLDALRTHLDMAVRQAQANARHGRVPGADEAPPKDSVLKVIGPSNSTMLGEMYEDASRQAFPLLEIYSPLATAERSMLLCGRIKPTEEMKRIGCADPAPGKREVRGNPERNMKILRTVSDDGRLASMLLDELRLRRVDPVGGVLCSRGMPQRNGTDCAATGGWPRFGRVALISEWDSFYSRSLAESFKVRVGDRARLSTEDLDIVDDWVLRFSYLRGVDGRLPDQVAKQDDKSAGKTDSKPGNLDLGTLERADGDSQLDYLRRLADHIAELDESYRQNGESGIAAIGVLGADAYDKLLVLQALKARMPNKLYFSTDLDARMLQRGQAESTRNLVLASPYGLTLTQALQQDVPPFRDSQQSAVFASILAAQSPRDFEYKQSKFDPTGGNILSPGIFEIGISGFIPLPSKSRAAPARYCEAPKTRRSWAAGEGRPAMTQDIMALSCLQDPPPPPYPQITDALRSNLGNVLAMWGGGWLILLMAALLLFLGWWWADDRQSTEPPGDLPMWVRRLPLAFYLVAGLFAWIAGLQWRVQLIWVTFVLIVLGILTAQLIRRHRAQLTTEDAGEPPTGSLFDSSVYYLLLPTIVFVLALLWGYQSRRALTENGLGEPMFFFEGISAWPTLALRLLAVLISISALAWGWRCLRLNRLEIERAYDLDGPPTTLWSRFPRPVEGRSWVRDFGSYLSLILFPLSNDSVRKMVRKGSEAEYPGHDGRLLIDFKAFWDEHCLGGVFGARLLRALLATWIFAVFTGVLFVLWPMEASPIRGQLLWGKAPWMLPVLAFQLLVFWVVDANYLLTRFIRQLVRHHAIWPAGLEEQHRQTFGIGRHACIDDWTDITLIARRTAAVNRLIYAPTVVLLILIASRSSVFDNWQTPPGLVISFVLTALILFLSALSLRRAAEKARTATLQHIDAQLLKGDKADPENVKFQMIRDRVAAQNTGAFSRYSEEPLVRALLVSLTGIGGSIIVDVVNFAKF